MSDRHFHGYRLNVGLNEDKTAIQSELLDLSGRMHRQVMVLQDELVRKALMEAGWTPPAKGPAGDEPLMRAILRCRYPVCKSIHPSGWGWDVPRLNGVMDEALLTQSSAKVAG